MLALLEPLPRREVTARMTGRLDGEDGPTLSAADPQELRELTYELLRKIEHKLGGLTDIDDRSIAATVAECEQVLAEIKAQLKSI